MRRLYDLGVNSLFQGVSVPLCNIVVVSLHEVIVEGTVCSLGLADCNKGKVQVVNWVGCCWCPYLSKIAVILELTIYEVKVPRLLQHYRA